MFFTGLKYRRGYKSWRKRLPTWRRGRSSHLPAGWLSVSLTTPDLDVELQHPCGRFTRENFLVTQVSGRQQGAVLTCQVHPDTLTQAFRRFNITWGRRWWTSTRRRRALAVLYPLPAGWRCWPRYLSGGADDSGREVTASRTLSQSDLYTESIGVTASTV